MRTWLLVTVPPACGVALALAVVPPWGGGGGAELPLPDSVAGLPARAAQETSTAVADDLAQRLRRDPAVAGVAVGAYDGGGVSAVVLRLSPRRPFDEQSAGRLTAEVLGRDGAGTDRVSRPSDDGEALLSCVSGPSTASPSSTCLAVEPGEAILVLTSGPVNDPVAFVGRVRDDVQAPVG